jgi:hypothetical protein
MKIVLMVVMIALAYAFIYSGVTNTSFMDTFSFVKANPKPKPKNG